MRLSRLSQLSLVLALGACAPVEPVAGRADTASVPVVPLAPVAAIASPPGAEPAPPDTGDVVVDRPTLVAFFPSNIGQQVDADTTGDLATINDDFMWYFAEASDTLAKLGVTVRFRMQDTLTFATTARRWRWAPARDSSDIGYYLVSPTRDAVVLYGVQVTDDLVQAVGPFVRKASPPPRDSTK